MTLSETKELQCMPHTLKKAGGGGTEGMCVIFFLELLWMLFGK